MRPNPLLCPHVWAILLSHMGLPGGPWEGPGRALLEPYMAHIHGEPHLGQPGPGQEASQPGPWEGPGRALLGGLLRPNPFVCPNVLAMLLSHMGLPGGPWEGPGTPISGPVFEGFPHASLGISLSQPAQYLGWMGYPRGWARGPAPSPWIWG